MKSRKASMNVKRKAHNEYVLPVMVYGSETWALKKAGTIVSRTAQNGAHHARHQTGVNYIIDVIKTECMDGRDTLHNSRKTVGQKERQSGHLENGQDGREDLKQDGGTALSATWVMRGQE